MNPRKFPEWFHLKNYSASGELDATDWYLNLYFRYWIKHELKTKPAVKERAAKELRTLYPVIRRASIPGLEQSQARLFFGNEDGQETLLSSLCVDGSDESAQGLRGPFMQLLRGNELTFGIDQLSTIELYIFEKMLPQTIRDFGSTFSPGYHQVLPRSMNDKFSGPLDEAFPERLLSSFIRLDLALPDLVLEGAFKEYVRRLRSELKGIAPKAPYLKGQRRLHRSDLSIYAEKQLLAYLDLRQWIEDDSLPQLTGTQWANLTGDSPDDLSKYLKRWAQDLDCRWWLNSRLLPAIQRARRNRISRKKK